MWRHSLLFFAAGSIAWGQSTVSGPSLGFFFDPQAQALRPIPGIPGSAVAGKNLDLGFPIAKAVVAPGQNYALAVSADGAVNLVKLATAGVTTQAITALPASPDQLVLSPNGRAAAFLYGASVAILTGLPDTVDALQHVDASVLPDAPATLAISDDGGVLLISSPDNGVFVFTAGNGAPRLISSGTPSGLMFLPDSHDALIADETARTLTAIQDAGNAAAPLWVFSDDRLGAPSLARASLDGQQVIATSASNNTLAVLDRNGGNAVFVPCTCSPTEINPLGGSAYKITDFGDGLLWILVPPNAGLGSGARIFFVPVPEASTSAQ
jgi:DNA-binding beta-propeller fold protein YncE